MNTVQKIVLLVGVAVIALMGVYPPRVRVEPGEAPHSMGYGLIWDPPAEQEQAKANFFGLNVRVDVGPLEANAIDVARLTTQMTVVAVVT